MLRVICLAIFALLACKADAVKESPEKNESETIQSLSVVGTQLVDEGGSPLVLRGVSFGWHNWWPRFYNEEVVSWLKEDWGVNVVRAAMGVEPAGAYLSQSDWSKEKIEAVVEAAIAADIYVIIDWHSHHIFTEDAKAFFQEMARKYGEHPHVIYEIYNEPVDDTWAEVKAYSEEVIRAIREIDPDNLILIGSPHWDQDIHLAADDPIVGFDNLMYTLHFYAATHKKFLRDKADYALDKGLPLFVSECAAMEATGNGPIDQKSWTDWHSWMEKNQLSWLTWSVSDKDETCSMLKPSASSKGNWKATDLKEWAILTKSYLKTE
ncbi:glycoside hydrolase family 5 protein [Echinicola sp. 20G]|uniref:glycoside hydrolase family 5 protein n=1 Tax=Echinicola sp. 20G TaxID=2781961 RepID=UPI001910D504|nr:glycoside hydrolase family 5 protein [Echinicola sp. 20G]